MKTDSSYRHKPEANACVPADTLWDYLEGKLTPAQQHQVEAHLLDCPMCEDALEGFRRSGNRAKVAQLNVEVANAMTKRSDWYLGAAAASVVMVATLGLLWWALGGTQKPQQDLAQEQPKAKDQTTISATTPEERGPGAPEPELNNPTSDGLVPLTNANSNTASSGNLSMSKPLSATSPAYATAPAAVERGGVEKEQDANPKADMAAQDQTGYFEITAADKSEQLGETTRGAIGTGPGLGTGAGSGAPAPSPAPVSPQRSYSTGSSNKAAKNKQAPSAAESTPAKSSLAEGMYYYNLANYDEALKVFKNVLSDDPNNQEARYYLGMSYKNKGDKSKALDELIKVNATCIYYEDAVWNRALLLIEAGKKEEAKVLLQQLTLSGGKYATKAQEKMKEL